MRYEFTVAEAPRLYVDLPAGDLRVAAHEQAPTDATVLVEVTGSGADNVTVEQVRDEIRVVSQRRAGFFSFACGPDVTVSAPAGSHLKAELGSADTLVDGDLAGARVVAGSGSIRLEAVTSEASVKTGSGDIEIGRVGGSADLKTGSGDVTVGVLTGPGRVSTGSGDVEIGRAEDSLALKSGSGDLRVGDAFTDVSLSTASGEIRMLRFRRGQARLNNVSGDIRLAIPPGTPVWTDISTVTGHLRSDLASTGAPADGQDHIELRARTVSGDIDLENSKEMA
jgi:DUF4097 and DUF4098 domain-containing protein YvlB